jgi:GMP synthase (glutamine-hydrolysing)
MLLARRGAERPQILVVLHQETSSPGRVGQYLVERGFHLDIRRPPLGDPLAGDARRTTPARSCSAGR